MEGLYLENPIVLALTPLAIVFIVLTKVYGVNRVYPKIYILKHPFLAILSKSIKKCSRKHHYISMTVHAIIASLIIIALANPYTIVREPVVGEETMKSKIEIKTKPPIVLVIDVSGSMGGVKIETAKRALKRFIDELSNVSDIGLIAFSDHIVDSIPPTSDVEKVYEKIDNLTAGGGTMYTYPLTAALNWLKSYRDLGVECMVVFATDGMPADVMEYRRLLPLYRDLSIPIYTIYIETSGVSGGFSSGLEEVKTIAESTGGEWFYAEDIGELTSIYDKIAEKAKSILKEVEVKASYTEFVEKKIYLIDYVLLTTLLLYIAYTVYRFRVYRLTL